MKNILQKCIDELAKPEPKLDYIRGMLEVLVEQEPETVKVANFIPSGYSELTKPSAPLNLNVNPHGLPPNDPGMDILSGKKIING